MAKAKVAKPVKAWMDFYVDPKGNAKIRCDEASTRYLPGMRRVVIADARHYKVVRKPAPRRKGKK